MFLDLVDSTAFSVRFDPEDWRELLRSFQKACVGAIERFGGYVHGYMGDGMIVYFGFPQAQEDAANRAALAGLAVLEEVERLNQKQVGARGITLQTRIGIHIGRVLAGEMGAGTTRKKHDIVGVTPNIAARLESLAPPDSVVVSAELKRRIEHDFVLESLGEKKLKGIEKPIEVFRLLAPLRDRVTALHGLGPSRNLTGRDREIGILSECWAMVAQGGKTRLVTIEGEPGIGKSGLAQLFLKRVDVPVERLVFLAGSAYDRHTPFAPVRHALPGQIGLLAEDGAAVARRRIEASLPGISDRGRGPIVALLRLLLTDVEPGSATERDRAPDRRELFRALLHFLKSKGQPLLLVLEDAHWADPSTLELVDRVLRQSADWPVLVIVLTRPGGPEVPWCDLDQTKLVLGGLELESCEKIVRRLSGRLPLEQQLFERIVTSTEGVPLFVEELTKSVLESGMLVERRGRLALTDPASDLETPATLLDLLTARLDRLGQAKDAVQSAAVIGRAFDFDALVFMTGQAAESIADQLAVLVRWEIVVEQDSGGDLRYRFRHALYQKAAYDGLLHRHRRKLHGRYLDWLDANPLAKIAVRYEHLAFHCERAGRLSEAIELWIEAGEIANSASASHEAARHFIAGLRVIGELPETTENQILALRLHVLLGGALMMSQGPGSPETRETYDQALSLCEAVPETPWHFPAYWGWWRVSENFNVMLARAQRLLKIASDMEEPEFILQAHHCHWVNAFMVGDHATCLDQAKRGLKIYEDGNFSQTGSLYGGHDPKVCGLGEMALSLWLTGHADQALATIEKTIAWAEELGHMGSRLHALDIALMLHHYRRDFDAVQSIAAQVRAIGEKNELDDYLAKAKIFEGWCTVERGDLAQGAALLEDGLATMRVVGTREDFPVYFSMVAHSRIKRGQVDSAIELLDEGLNVIALEGMAYWAPEIYRNIAEALMTQREPDAKRIDELLSTAIQIARSQDALALELRAVLSQVHCFERRGEARTALTTLAEVSNRVTEGWDTPDLQDAAALLGAFKAASGETSNEHA